jgi:hypothetical protein
MTQDAFDWLDLTLRRGRPTRETNRFLTSRPENPFHAPRESTWSRFPIRYRPAIPPSPTPRTTPAQRDRYLLPTFCSRLVVTCTLQDTPLPGSKALTLAAATPLPHLQQDGHPAFREARARPRRLAIAGVTSPGWPTGWCPIDQPKPNHRPMTGCSVSRASPPAALSV